MVEDTRAFFEELIKFYKASVLGTAGSVDALIRIEEEFPENYLKLKEATFDPEKIDEVLSSMTDKEKETFLLIFTKASIISRKLYKLFDLGKEDKIKLAKEIRDFADFAEEKLRELSSKVEESPR